MGIPHSCGWTDPAIRVVSAGLGAAVAGPLGGALGGWLGGLFGAQAAPLIEKYAVKFGEKGGEKLLESLTDSLIGKTKEGSADLERVWRDALRLSLDQAHQHIHEDAFESWFTNWETCLQSPAPLNLPWITPGQLTPGQLDSLFRLTMERLDSQGGALRHQSLSLHNPIRSIPPHLLAELNARLPDLLQDNIRTLIIRQENESAWKQMNLAFQDILNHALGLIPQIHRLLEDELVRALGDGRVAREEARAARLREETLHARIEQLRDENAQYSVPPPARLWNLPERNEFFSGRTAYLDELRRSLAKAGAVAVTQKASRAISGLGGIGKTQTAVEYAYRYREEYTAAFFVLADSQPNVDTGFAAIARLVGESAQLDDAILAAKAKDWLQHPRNAGWLLILDNVDDLAHIKRRIPAAGGHVLITTRLNFLGRLATKIELPHMDAVEGASFLLERANRKQPNEPVDLAGGDGRAALDLSAIMGGLPLALEQAGAYIAEMASSPAEYLRFFRDEGVRLLGRTPADSDHDSVLVTFNLAFERLSEPARDVLRLCSLLAPEGIPEEVVIGKQPTRGEREAIGEAARYSLVTAHKSGAAAAGTEPAAIDIHRLVQDVVRNRMSPTERQAWVERALKAVNRTVFGTEEMRDRATRASRLQREHFAPYRATGYRDEDESFWLPLDPVPYVIPPQEWRTIEKAIEQRARLLDALLADEFGPQRARAVLPSAALRDRAGYLATCAGLPAIDNRRMQIYAAILLHVEDGTWMIVEDRTEIATGLSLALENRSVLSRIVPETLQRFEIRSLAPFFEEYIVGIKHAAPQLRDHPHVVLLSPGRYNSAHFEHAYLAHQCGFALVEGRDLFVTDDGIFQYSVSGPRAVDVILRRVNTEFCDPRAFRTDSVLGVAGLVEAVRRMQVSVVNTLGSGMASNPIYQSFLPQLCQFLLGEDLLMPSTPAWWCGDPEAFHYVQEHLDELVVFDAVRGDWPVDGVSGQELVKLLSAEPARYVARAMVRASALPATTEAGGDERYGRFHVFATATPGGYSVMPGGLCRITEGRTSARSASRAVGTKDVWVIGEVEPDRGARPAESVGSPALLSLRHADSFFWLGRYAERLNFCVQCFLELMYAIGENDSAKDDRISRLIRVLAWLEAWDPRIGDDPRDSQSFSASITVAIFSERTGSPRELADAVLANCDSVELLLPREALNTIRLTRPILLSRTPHAPPEDIEQLLRQIAALLADFEAEVEASDWRETGWHMLRLGHHAESFHLAVWTRPEGAGDLARQAHAIDTHLQALPTSGALRSSLEETSRRFDQAIDQQEWMLAESVLDGILTLLKGTFIG